MLIDTVSVETEQVPFEIDQTNELRPKLNPVTPEFSLFGFDTIPEPTRTVQAPEPNTGVLAVNVAIVELQIVCSSPASAVVGN